MNLNELRFASAVARLGSFSAAADACCVTQPTLSGAVARLEDELGERLFFRTTRKVSLTPFGAYILPHLDEVLSAQASLRERAASFVRPTAGSIHIGVSPLVSIKLLSPRIESFREKHPELAIAIHEMGLVDLDRKLADGTLDFVFEVEEPRSASRQSMLLYREPLFYVPRRGVMPRQAEAGSVRLADIADETFIVVPEACGLASATRALFRSQRRQMKEYSGDGVSCQVLEECVTLGIAAAILPRSKLASSSRRAVPIADDCGSVAQIAITATWPRKDSRPRYLAEFIDHIGGQLPAPRLEPARAGLLVA